MIVGVGDVDVAGSINSYPLRVFEAGSSTVGVGRPGGANGAGKCGDDTGRADHSYQRIAVVGDVDVAGSINSHPAGKRSCQQHERLALDRS